MSGKLDIALDDIVKEKRQNTRRTRRVARSAKPTTAAAGPATGVKKNKSAKATTTKKAAAPTPAAPAANGPSKIIVSNLVSILPRAPLDSWTNLPQPTDVTEAQIKVR
jgi:pyruvate/2-oxoglutarate dehydrogenase complex dihydrolipoamide acyltransferase (E2) component